MNVHATAGTGESGLASKPWERGPDGYPRGECWYVVEARAQTAESAYLRLAVAGLQVWMPVDLKRHRLNGRPDLKRRDRPVPRFGRYFFVRCRMNATLQHAISTEPCVAGLLLAARADTPAPIPDAFIAWTRENPGKPADAPTSKFGRGDVVRIMRGPFAGFCGRVEDVDKSGALRIDIEIFGRPTPLVIEVGHVEIEVKAKPSSIKAFQQSAGSDSRGVRKHS